MKNTIKSSTTAARKSPHFIETLWNWWQFVLPPTLLAMLTIVFYYPSLSYPFQFDDLANITKKFDIRFFDPASLMLTNSRWLGEWLNRFNYQIGRFDPWTYRSFNLAIHVITGLLVFVLFYALCRRSAQRPFLATNAFWIGLTTMALFLLHPVQTQTISYVIQARLEGLAALFVVATILTFVAAFQTTNIFVRALALMLTTALGFVSCGTKEIVIVTPFLLMLVDWFFIAESSWQSFRTRIWFHVFFLVFMFASLLFYLKPKFLFDVLGLQVTTANNRGNILTNKATDIITPLHFLISEFKVILHYFVMFLWPFNISVEYDWKLASSFFAPDAFFPMLALIAIAVMSIRLARNPTFNYITFGFWWFLIGVAPRSSIIPSPELICDYKTYLASIGWLFVLATGIIYGIEWILAQPLFKRIPYINSYYQHATIMALLVTGLGSGTMVRNLVWQTPVTFWRDIVVKAPLKARGHNNLGVALSEEGKFEESIPHYLEAIRLDGFYSDPWSNLAVAYSVKGDDDKAVNALQEAIRIFPNYPEAYNNLGTLFIKKKDFLKAEQLLTRAIQLRPWYGKALFNMARLHLEQQHNEQAWEYFKRATMGDLDTVEGFNVLGQMSLQLQKYDEAIAAFNRVVELGVVIPQIAFNLANAYFLSGNYPKARAWYTHLVQTQPNDPRYHYNLAETYFAEKEFEKAHDIFKSIGVAAPSITQAHVRAAHCLEQLQRIDAAKAYLHAATMTSTTEEFKKIVDTEIRRMTMQSKVVTGTTFTARASDMKDLRMVISGPGAPATPTKTTAANQKKITLNAPA